MWSSQRNSPSSAWVPVHRRPMPEIYEDHLIPPWSLKNYFFTHPPLPVPVSAWYLELLSRWWARNMVKETHHERPIMSEVFLAPFLPLKSRDQRRDKNRFIANLQVFYLISRIMSAFPNWRARRRKMIFRKGFVPFWRNRFFLGEWEAG